MSMIDRQRIAAVKAMEAKGYTFDGNGWNDALHSLLVVRADRLLGCVEGSGEEAEFKVIAEAVMAYEAKRWPDGKVPGGKG